MKPQDIILAVVALLLSVLIWAEFRGLDQPKQTRTTDSMRSYAAQLKANQLYEKSAEAYDRYVETADIPDSEKANIDYNTGLILLENVGDAEGALAHFLRVTELYSEANKDIQKEARKLSAECLERLGRSGAAERELIAASKVGASDTDDQTPVEIEEAEILAQIGERVAVTRTDLEQSWEGLPAYVREAQYPGSEGKHKLLQELTSARLFAEAAKRKGLDRIPEIRSRLRNLEENLLAAQLMQTEVTSRVTLTEEDLTLFHAAHQGHYTQPAELEIAHIQVADTTALNAAQAALQSGSAFAEVALTHSSDTRTAAAAGELGRLTLLRKPIDPPAEFDPLDVVIPGIGKSKSLVAAALAIGTVGEITGPIDTPRGLHLIQLLDRTPAKPQSFDQARREVEADVRARREQKLRAELIESLMKVHQVRLYPDRVEG